MCKCELKHEDTAEAPRSHSKNTRLPACLSQLWNRTNRTLKGRFQTAVIKTFPCKVTQAGVGVEVVRVGVSRRTGSDKAPPRAAVEEDDRAAVCPTW